MDIRILNKDFQWEYTIDSYKSFIWTERYQECGDFEIYLPMRKELLEKIKLDYYVEIDGSDYMMIVEELKTTTDPDDGDMLIISGRDLLSITMRRVCSNTSNFNNANIWSILATYWRAGISCQPGENNTTPSSREIKGFIRKYGASSNVNVNVSMAPWLMTLYDLACEAAKVSNAGIRVVLIENDKVYPDLGTHFQFEVYEGTDRSYNQQENPWVIFSDEFGNLHGTEFVYSKKDFSNVAAVGAESPWSVGTSVASGSTMTTVSKYYYDYIALSEYGSSNNIRGIDRYELAVNCSGITPNAGNFSSANETNFKNSMYGEGRMQLGRHKIKQEFTGEGENTPQWIYKKDYFLGDIVQVEDKYGNSAPARISEFIFCDDDANGEQMYPKFSMV